MDFFMDYDAVTPKQTETIKRIELILGIEFSGKTKQDAMEFISAYMGDSIRRGTAPVSASQQSFIDFITDTLSIYIEPFNGNTFEDAARFIKEHHPMAKQVHREQKEYKKLKRQEAEKPLIQIGENTLFVNGQARDIQKTCSGCGKAFHATEITFHQFLNNTKLCSNCYSDWLKTDEHKNWKESFNTDEGVRNLATPVAEQNSKPVKRTQTKPKKEGNKMFNNFKSVLGDFGKVTDGQFKLSFQGLAIKTGDEAYAVYDAEEHRMIDVMDFVADAEGMVYKMPTQINQLQQGDIIIAKNKPLIVKSVTGNSIRALNPITNNETTHKPAGNLFGIQFITKVVSLFDMMQGQAGTAQGFNPMMLMMLNKDGNSKMDDLMPLMMMGGMQGGTNPMQNMLPLMMMSGKGDNSSMMEMMMLSQMMGGQQGGFNFGGMFSQTPTPAPVAPAEPSREQLIAEIIAELSKRNGAPKSEAPSVDGVDSASF